MESLICLKLDLLDPPIEKACYYLEEKHVTKSCVARNSAKKLIDILTTIVWEQAGWKRDDLLVTVN